VQCDENRISFVTVKFVIVVFERINCNYE
jgi:hypothetical protein